MRSRNLGRAIFGLLIAHQLEADHQPQAPHVADVPEPLGPIAQPIENVAADLRRVGDQFTFEQFDGRQRRRHRHGIPAKGGRVRAGRPVHDLGARDHRAQRQSARDAFRAW